MPPLTTSAVRCQCGQTTAFHRLGRTQTNPVTGQVIPLITADDKCPNCHTFATDHPFRGDARSDWRCWDCDARYHSHRK